jgi:hypothetical protein
MGSLSKRLPKWAVLSLVAFNVILVIAVPVILVMTENNWHACMEHVPPLRTSPPNPPGLAECQSNVEAGDALAFLLIAIGIVIDLLFLAIWLLRKHVDRRSMTITPS